MKENDTKSQNNAKDLKIQEENLTTEYSQKTARGEKDILQQQELNKYHHENSYTNRQYKDRLFKFIFKDKEKLLSLYNALNSSHYTNAEDIEITTLEDVIYCKMKNDISFIIDDRLSLFEHQSSYNPNMPLRGFLYFARHFERYIEENEVDIYGKKLIELPTPKFIVFYNGNGMEEERTVLRLSDSFIHAKEKACMELEAEVLNINYGNNKELMESCRPLMEYAYFVQKVKAYSKEHQRDKAIELAVNDCIKEEILKEILIKNRAEVVDMLLTEYDEEKRIRIMEKQIEIAMQRAKQEQQEKEIAVQRAKQEQQEKEIAMQQAEEYQQQIQELQQQILKLTEKQSQNNKE